MDSYLKDIVDEFNKDEELRPCFCVGPQPGEKLCPCALKSDKGREIEFLNNIMKIRGRSK